MRTFKLQVNCSLCWLPWGEMELTQIFPKVVPEPGRAPTSAPHGQGLGRDTGGGEQRVYVFTAKSGWELARIIVYNPATQHPAVWGENS